MDERGTGRQWPAATAAADPTTAAGDLADRAASGRSMKIRKTPKKITT
jgi:hypothetical protein